MFLIQDNEINSRVIGALKRVFSRSPATQSVLKKHRIEETCIKKDGQPSKRPSVLYPCAVCGKLFKSTDIQVDHIDPVVPVSIPARHMSFDTLVKRLFCEEGNLQLLCKQDHAMKGSKEKELRNWWEQQTKFIVYETTNKLNGRKYIGVHKCTDYNDVYLGSGKLIRYAIKKYGVGNFYRTILFVYDNPEDAYSKESELVTDQVVASDDWYNLVTGGGGDQPRQKDKNCKRVVCHQTGEMFDSVTLAAESLGVEHYSISRVLDKPDSPIKNLHFFRATSYDPKVIVTFPNNGRGLFHFNSGTSYSSIKEAADAIGLNYKSLRNALSSSEDEVVQMDGHFFIYSDSYDKNEKYAVAQKVIRKVGSEQEFATCSEAAASLKGKKRERGGIAIGRAARTGCKMYGHYWEWHTKQLELSH